MTATITEQIIVRYLLTAYCPKCGKVVESNVLAWASHFASDDYGELSLMPHVQLRKVSKVRLWMHLPCGGVLVPVWNALML